MDDGAFSAGGIYPPPTHPIMNYGIVGATGKRSTYL